MVCVASYLKDRTLFPIGGANNGGVVGNPRSPNDGASPSIVTHCILTHKANSVIMAILVHMENLCQFLN
jgi:hypothetical protein